MDAQLKQRLTGAVILVLLAVLFVPELLRGPRGPGPAATATPETQPASGAAPTTAEGAPLRSYEIDLSDEPRAAVEPPEDAAPAADAPAAAAPPSTTAPASSQGGSAPAARGPAGASSASKDGAGAASGPAPAVPQPAESAARARASSSAPSTGASPPQRGFAVQLGSFASRDSAERLANELRGRRFETFVSPVRSGNRQLYRVRVGPVPDRAAAQALAARLKSAGQKGSVVPLP